MTRKPFHTIFKASFMLIILLFSSCDWGGKHYSIENRTWDVCVKTDFANPKNECSYLVTYVFDKDGTFYEFSKLASDSIQKLQSSRKFSWKLYDNLLTVNVKTGNREKVIQHEINWVDNSRFYTIEKNSKDETVETWYNAKE